MIFTLIITVLIIYSIMIMVFCFGWMDQSQEIRNNAKYTDLVSIIIACRNEESNIKKCLKSIINQTYKNIEVIIVDDHSEDKTVKIINNLSTMDSRIKLLKLPRNTFGKKNALNFASNQANGEILFFTDADCILKPNHIAVMLSFFDNKTEMVCGPVELINKFGYLQKLFQLEFLSLIGSGAAGIFLKIPFMCNGANYAIRKTLYETASKHLNNKYSSGDDVFLLHYISKKNKVRFAKNINCIVKTQSPSNLKEFISQRIRWAGKAKGYKNITAIIVSGITFLMSLATIMIFAKLIISEKYQTYLLLILLCKLIMDISLLFHVLRFHKKLTLLLYSPILIILHPFYIVFTAISSIFYKPEWKGRKVEV